MNAPFTPAPALPTHIVVPCSECEHFGRRPHCDVCDGEYEIDARCDHGIKCNNLAVIQDGSEYYCLECAEDCELITSVSHLTVPSLEACRVGVRL